MNSVDDPHRSRRGSPGPLVGRESEQRALGAALAAALAGRGSLTVVAGEAGAGRTRLVESLGLDAASRGALVLVGRCYDVSFSPLYGVWVDLFGHDAHLGEGLPLPTAFAHRGSLDTIANQPALFEEVRGYLAALSARRPVVLLFEDLQWADPPSLELVRYMAREVATHRLMIVATVSEDALGRGQPLHRLLPAIERESRASRLTLARLGPEDLHRLVVSSYALPAADVVRLVAYLTEMTGGNALFVTELLRALEDERVLRRADRAWALDDLAHVGMPLRLRQVIDNRLLRLPEDELDLLAAAAVIGPEVRFSLWAEVFGGDEETTLRVLEAAADAHLVEPAPDGITFRFVHALVREALYERIFPVRRRVMHRRVGEALARLPDPDPDAVARHFHDADDDRAAEWLVRAGERAEGAGALRTAVERYEAALRPLERSRATPAEQARVLLGLAVLRRMDDSWRAVTYADRAMRLAGDAADPELSARVLLGRGIVRCYAGVIVEGIDDLVAGVAAIDALSARAPERAARASQANRLLNRGALVYWLAVAGRLDEARPLAEEHLRRVAGTVADKEKTADIAGLNWGLAFVHAAHGRVGEAQLAYAAACAAYQKLGQHRLAFVALRDELVYVALPYRTDDLAERERLAGALRQMADAGNAARAFVDAIDNVRYPLLHLMALEGRWAEVHQVIGAMGDYGVPILRHVVGSVLGPIARAQGEVDLAWRMVRETWHAGPSTVPGHVECYHTLPQQRLAVELCMDGGDLLGAQAWLEAHERWLAWSGFELGRSEACWLRARYEWALGHPERARRHAEEALAVATAPRQPLALLSAHRLLGELITASGREQDAEPHLLEALALADACGAPYERALTELALAEHRLARDRPDTVPELLAAARSRCEPLGAVPLLGRVRALEMRAAAQRPVVISYPAGLTEREAEVLGLLAGGLSDKEIAGLLHLSPRTVGRHVEKAYRKVGAHRRAEAAVFAIRHGLIREEQA